VALYAKYRVFKGVLASGEHAGKALATILIFLSAERKAAKATKQKLLSAGELSQVLAGVDSDALFPEKSSFPRQPQLIESRLQKAWPEWADLHFARAFGPELAQLQALKTRK
jgi:hypothetical protein